MLRGEWPKFRMVLDLRESPPLTYTSCLCKLEKDSLSEKCTQSKVMMLSQRSRAAFQLPHIPPKLGSVVQFTYYTPGRWERGL